MPHAAYHLDPSRGLDGLVARDQEEPEPGPHDVVIRVRAGSLNRRDIMLMEGSYPIPAAPGVIPLSDGAGEVVAVGAKVQRAAVGDRVTATYFLGWVDGEPRLEWLREQHGANHDGMLASFARVHEDSVVHLPAHLSWAEAATLTCAAVTAWSGLNGPRPVAAGETVLTVGTGTVALFGVQLARDLGARVIAITSGEEKAARLRALGAAEVVDRRAEPDWDKAVRELTAGQGVDHVLEAVGPATLDKSLNSLAFGGHVAVCGAFPAGGVTLEDRLFVGGLFTIRRLVVGSRAAFEALSTSLERHTTRPVIDRVFGFDEAREAYRYFRDDNPFGKVVITLP